MSTRRRLGLAFAVALSLIPLLMPTSSLCKPPQPDREVFTGKIVPVAEAVDKLGAKMDRDAAPHWLALETKNGQLYPLLKDPGSRMFFKDKNLVNQPVELTGRLLKNSQILQVFSVRMVRNGKLHEPYYWCDICKIKRFEPNNCDCCGAPLEFREEPVTK